MRFCPFAHRVHLTLNAKSIPYHVFYINLMEKPEWYSHVNPNGKVPALQMVDEPNEPILTESMDICEYLDQKYPDVKLFPTDQAEKDQLKSLVDGFSPIATAFYRLVYEPNNTAEVVDQLLKDLHKGLDDYEAELAKRGTPYFGGDKPSILDYAIWPWFERLGVLKSIVEESQYKFDDEHYPKLVRILMIFNSSSPFDNL